VKDAACPISTKGEGGVGGPAAREVTCPHVPPVRGAGGPPSHARARGRAGRGARACSEDSTARRWLSVGNADSKTCGAEAARGASRPGGARRTARLSIGHPPRHSTDVVLDWRRAAYWTGGRRGRGRRPRSRGCGRATRRGEVLEAQGSEVGLGARLRPRRRLRAVR